MIGSGTSCTPNNMLGSGNQLHPTGLHQPALPLSHRTRTPNNMVSHTGHNHGSLRPVFLRYT